MATCPTCRKQYPDDVRECADDGDSLLPDEAFESYLEPGATVGEYQIEGRLGEGGFGVVYSANHPVIGKRAAIKVLNRQYSSNPHMVSRFIAEARAVNQIRHRNIIDIFSFGTLEDGRHYFVMELLEGVPLDRYLADRERIPPSQAIAVLGAVARALEAAHGCGVAHRDLKPENVFLEQDRDGVVYPKLLDFGIAKLLAESAATHKTRTGSPIGTPAYMSPEQCHGKSIDHRTDIYSFGILTYEALTGKLPFDGDNVMTVLFKQVHEAPVAPSVVCPALPAALDAPILRMLEKDPAARPETITAAMESLAEAAATAGVPVSSIELRGGAFRSGPITPSDLPRMPSDASASFVEAKTVQSKTLQGAASDVSESRAPLRRLFLGVAVSVVVIGAVAYFSWSGAKEPAPAASATPTATVSTAAAQVTSDEPLTPSATATAEAAEVDIEILSVQPGTDVLLAGTKIGTAPGMVHVPRSDRKVMLTLRARGYRDLEVELTPDRNRTLTPSPMVKLGGRPQPQSKKADKKELEDPGL